VGTKSITMVEAPESTRAMEWAKVVSKRVSPFHRLSSLAAIASAWGSICYDLSIHVMQAGKSNWALKLHGATAVAQPRVSRSPFAARETLDLGAPSSKLVFWALRLAYDKVVTVPVGWVDRVDLPSICAIYDLTCAHLVSTLF
jgi:hypothetical protein